MEDCTGEVSTVTDSNRDLLDLWSAVWRHRWQVVALTATFGLLGVLYATLAPKWYRAEVLLVQARDGVENNLVSQFGGLASLAGVNLGSRDDVEPMAVLKSRGFAQTFIEEQGLAEVLLANKWDSAQQQWKGPKEDWPDVRDAVEYFDKKVRRVMQDRKTGLVTLAMEWKDPQVAADWASAMAEKLNSQMRDRAIADATDNIRFLRAEIASNDLIALQQPLGKLLELELQKLMLARNNKEFSFRIIDVAQPPKKSIRPKLVPSSALGIVLGAFLSVIILVTSRMVRVARSSSGAS